MAVLAIFEVSSIQNFIFSTNKLKECCGGSLLVRDVFNVFLPQAMGEVLGIEKIIVDWQNSAAFAMMENKEILAEIVYVGGGNAMVAFRKAEDYQKVCDCFIQTVFEQTYLLHGNVVSAAVETNWTNYQDDSRKLFGLLSIQKSHLRRTKPAPNLPITDQSPSTGLPVISYNNMEYLSADQVLKRARYKNETENNKKKNKETYGIHEISEFDDLVLQKGESSFIGVIHIDGNNMGKRIHDIMADATKYDAAVQRMRKLSQVIDRLFHDSLVTGLSHYEHMYMQRLRKKRTKADKDKKADERQEEYVIPIPIRVIIADGDDITIVTNGQTSISLAVHLLKIISNKSGSISYIDVNGSAVDEVIEFTACAGVVLCQSHFPFSEAYDMAESCCDLAKKRAKAEQGVDKVGSWLDIHLNKVGSLMPVEDFREQIMVDTTGQNLLWRPWKLTASADPNPFDVDWFLTQMEQWIPSSEKEESEINSFQWPRSRLKALRDAFPSGNYTIMNILSENKSRGYQLPALPAGSKAVSEDEMDPICILDTPSKFGLSKWCGSPYYDVLELMDLFEPHCLQEMEEEK